MGPKGVGTVSQVCPDFYFDGFPNSIVHVLIFCIKFKSCIEIPMPNIDVIHTYLQVNAIITTVFSAWDKQYFVQLNTNKNKNI